MADNLNTIRSFSGKRQILVVDDEMINWEILGEYLKDDYDVLFAEDGVQAMEMVRSHKDTLSLILLDLLMPVVPGKEVLKHVKEDPELYHIPVIVMTADQESEVECLSLGAIDFIPKPYPQVSVVLARILRTIELFEDRNIIMSTERDELTGLYNKAYFYRYAELFDMYHKDTATDALYLDVIHFRMINERYGKNFGDIVLKSIAETLRRIVHDSGGIVCRREADVFLIYCPHREDYHKPRKRFPRQKTPPSGSGCAWAFTHLLTRPSISKAALTGPRSLRTRSMTVLRKRSGSMMMNFVRKRSSTSI